MCLRPLACWDCGFESRRGHVCLSVVIVVSCQVEVSAKGRSLVQGIPTDCVCVCVCVSLRVIKCNSSPLHHGEYVEAVGITKEERNKEK